MSDRSKIFISYKRDNKKLVEAVADKLSNSYEVWRDDSDLVPGQILSEALQKNIQDSKIVLAFITKAYCESENCKLEFFFAKRIAKPMLYIMLEKLDIQTLPSGIGMYLAEQFCYNAYHENWTDKIPPLDITILLKAVENLVKGKA